MLKSFLKKESNKAWFLFLLRTILFFLVIRYFFIAYTGIATEGGSLYSPFLAEHLNFISVFRKFLLWGGSIFVSLTGYNSYYTEFFLVIPGGASVKLVYSCLGFDLIAAYVALVFAWPAKLFKTISLLVGTSFIIVLNMIRLAVLVVMYATRHEDLFKYINHHDLFNIIMLVIVLCMFALYVKYSENKVQRSND